jgi:hypothetical protein
MSGAILPFPLVYLWLAVELHCSNIYPLRENGVVTPYAGGSSEMNKEI